MLAARQPLPVLVGIGLVAGLFATLFGVGGGIVVVPLLIALVGFDPRVATGTSLAAIALTAAFGVVSYVVLDRVQWAEAAMVGLPAVLGGLAGLWLQRRLSSRFLVLLFAAFLVATAARLLAT
ncbi:MAG: sulfite exporter TauE/SafE family protein [Thermoleophilia bacterium]|nr:sulfite exporter TauE/SafE family protein [Thermoleophilia bacterium]